MAKRPNIVVILVDDMGYSDIGCYGGPIRTPNLDALAAGGVRFTHAFNSARCCPARAALLTGLYPHMAGMGWMTSANLGTDGYAGDLNTRCLTIPEALTGAGYRSYMSGKWHLTRDKFEGPDGPKDSWPMQRGFHRYFGTLAGCGSYWKPHTLTRDNERIEAPDKDFYYTDAISDNACRFVSDHCDERAGEPFFMYVAYTAPHWPIHAKPEDIARYRGRFRRGWDVLREEKYRRMRDMGLLDGWKLSGRDSEVPPWDSLTPEAQDAFDLRMAVYAAQVDCMDQGVGRIVQTLRERGVLDDTLILFLSDNGGCHEEIHWKSPDPATFGSDASYESYGRPWANYSNVPFRMFKSWVHEGGIATPLIVRWPGHAPTGGGLCHEPVHITDVMPTCLDAAGAKYDPPAERHAWPLVGKSILPALHGGRTGRERIFWEHEGNRALREGKWKLVAMGVDGPWELYNMEHDRTELNDLAASEPKRVVAMAARWQQIAEDTGVFPLDGRDWEARIKSSK